MIRPRQSKITQRSPNRRQRQSKNREKGLDNQLPNPRTQKQTENRKKKTDKQNKNKQITNNGKGRPLLYPRKQKGYICEAPPVGPCDGKKVTDSPPGQGRDTPSPPPPPPLVFM